MALDMKHNFQIKSLLIYILRENPKHLYKMLLILMGICLFGFSPVKAETINIFVSGTVTDSITGEPLPFANIISSEKNIQNKVTDIDGRFRFNSKANGSEWRVSYMGYEPFSFKLGNFDTILNVKLIPEAHNLTEIIVKPHKDKYSKKNNPAVDFVKLLRSKSRAHDPSKAPFYSYDKYEKTLLSLNNFKGDFSSGFLSKKGLFLKNYVDTSSWTGKTLLNLILKEKYSSRIISRNPKSDKEIITGYRNAGLDEVLSQENIKIILEDAIREVDIYENDITIFQNRFVSPLSAIGPDFYKYYLTDTTYIGDQECIELEFIPHSPESMGFNGKIYIPVNDTSMFVKKVTMRVPHAINLNYIRDLFINQSFERDSIGNRHKVYDDVCVEMQIMPGSPELYGRKTTVYKNFSYERRQDMDYLYDKLGRYFTLDSCYSKTDDFWETNRMIPLTRAEKRMGQMTKEMRTVPLFYWAEKFLSLMESGYVKTGNPSKIDLGPLNTLVSANDVEGARIRIGGMTMSPLNSHLFAKGYIAYGTKDHKFKYQGDLEYSFTRKKNHSYEWPRHSIFASCSYDLDMIGQHYLFTNADNVFLSLKRKKSTLVTYRHLAKLGYILELPNNFSVETNIKYEKQEATPWLPFINSNGKIFTSYKTATAALTLRWAPGEKFIQGRSQRLPVNMDAWIFQFTHEFGAKGFLQSDFTINKSEFSLQKRLWFSAFGYADIIFKVGKIWSSVYYPALMWPNANLSYTIQPESYSLMNAMEFANDEYIALDFTYFGNGILFNRIPLLKKLKMREAFTFKALSGHLDDKNNPDKNNELLKFPNDSHSRLMSSTPYMEIGVGLDNILTFLRVDYIWRLTYKDTPGCDKSGVRISLHFSF